MPHDSSGPRRLQALLAELGNPPIWDKDKDKVVLVIDHYVPEADDESRRIVAIARDWAAEQHLPHVHDSQGICHVVLPQAGHLRPGMFCVGGDSHTKQPLMGSGGRPVAVLQGALQDLGSSRLRAAALRRQTYAARWPDPATSSPSAALAERLLGWLRTVDL